MRRFDVAKGDSLNTAAVLGGARDPNDCVPSATSDPAAGLMLGTDVPGQPDGDPRRRHHAWDGLQDDRQAMLEKIVDLAARWNNVPVRHELELAAFASDVWRTLEASLGDHLISMMAAVSTVMEEATPAGRQPLLERPLRHAAHPVVHQALAEARDVAKYGPDTAWHDTGEMLFAIGRSFLDSLLRVASGEILEELLVSNPLRITRDAHWLICPVCGLARQPIAGPPSKLRLLR